MVQHFFTGHSFHCTFQTFVGEAMREKSEMMLKWSIIIRNSLVESNEAGVLVFDNNGLAVGQLAPTRIAVAH